SLHEWISAFSEALDLENLINADGASPDDLEALVELLRPSTKGIPLVDFAQCVQLKGRVVVTTCHAAKGRQFDVVILPGLQVSLFPSARWRRGAYPLTPNELAVERRLFYVGLTRARYRVIFVYSMRFRNKWGYS